MSKPVNYSGQAARIADHPIYAKALLDSTKEAVTIPACYRYTDKQLVMAINQSMMKRGLRVSPKTWALWRDAYINNEQWILDNANLSQAFAYIEKSILDAMDFLLDKLETERGWQRYAWILERKFDQWKLKQDVNVTGELNHNVKIVLNVPEDVPVITDEQTMEAKYDIIE